MKAKDIFKSKDWLSERTVTRKTVFSLISEWQFPLGMVHWTLEANFRERTYLASCYAEPQYYKGTLYFNYKRMESELLSDFDLEELVVHEMCHCKSWPLAAMAGRLIEYVGDESGELEKQRDDHDEQLITSVGQALVMMKYGLTELPDSVKLRHWDDKVWFTSKEN